MNALHDLDPGGRDPVVDTWKPEPTPAPLALLAMTAANAAQATARAASSPVRSRRCGRSPRCGSLGHGRGSQAADADASTSACRRTASATRS